MSMYMSESMKKLTVKPKDLNSDSENDNNNDEDKEEENSDQEEQEVDNYMSRIYADDNFIRVRKEYEMQLVKEAQ